MTTRFDLFASEFIKHSRLGQDMLAIREDSKWHREENVATHSRMTIRWYKDNLANSRTPEQQIITMLALLFHDVGKPMCRTEKFSEERGTYYSYPGHEHKSARLFEDYFLRNWQDMEFMLDTHLGLYELNAIKCLIEHHLPYEKTGKDKLMAIRAHIDRIGGPELEQMYFDILRSDAHGRISDDPEGTYARVENWIEQFQQTPLLSVKDDAKENKPTLIVPIGASGSGKSSYNYEIFSYDDADDGPSHVLFNLDNLRIDFYVKQTGNIPDYSKAWNYIHRNEDKQVEKDYDSFTLKIFTTLVKEGKSIYLDFSNATAKSRRKWITLARQHNYYVIGVHFAIPLQVCIDRQQTRGDKCIPRTSVEQQYFAISTPMIGTEVNELYTIFSYDHSEIK